MLCNKYVSSLQNCRSVLYLIDRMVRALLCASKIKAITVTLENYTYIEQFLIKRRKTKTKVISL